MKKKIERGQNFIERNADLFACPLCKRKMTVKGHGLSCESGHQFDLSKKGTLYFLHHPIKTNYDKNLFDQRRKMIEAGMYQPLIALLAEFCENEQILDVGCGEGSFLQAIASATTLRPSVGFDISKEAIYLASDDCHDILWCTADLTSLPFRPATFSTILNIFSPSNYQQFDQVLKKGGQVIKVVPQKDYLKELRQAFYPGNVKKQEYSNEKVVAKFQQAFPKMQQKRLSYCFAVPKTHRLALLDMSPLEWGLSDQQKLALGQEPIKEITVDLDILLGEKM